MGDMHRLCIHCKKQHSRPLTQHKWDEEGLETSGKMDMLHTLSSSNQRSPHLPALHPKDPPS
ncbi:hypothetical protein NQZ68_022193 [Dissostichus eleginoides]|nr:hypothetical protein NQZ68_022193 [Dissostichus eleginoides]